MSDIRLSDNPSSSLPCSLTEPDTSAYSGSSPTTAIAVADSIEACEKALDAAEPALAVTATAIAHTTAPARPTPAARAAPLPHGAAPAPAPALSPHPVAAGADATAAAPRRAAAAHNVAQVSEAVMRERAPFL